MNNDHGNRGEWASVTSLVAGVASVILWEFGIIPILAVVFGIIGLVRDEKKWKAGIGLLLGTVFLVVRISQGHIDGIFSNSYTNNTPSRAPSAISQQTSVTEILPQIPVSTTPAPSPSQQTAEQEEATCKREFGATAYLRNASTGYCGYTNDPTNQVLIPGVTVLPHSVAGISNPDYLANPSAYLVDNDNSVDAGEGDALSMWVEDIYSPIGLKFSYVVKKEGKLILKFGSYPIIKLEDYGSLPGGPYSSKQFRNAVSNSTQLECWKNGQTEFLRENALHKKILLTEFAPNAQIGTVMVLDNTGNPVIDLVESAIKNGYGFLSYNEKDMAVTELLKSNDPEGIYRRHLLDLLEISSLEKPGLWVKCK